MFDEDFEWDETPDYDSEKIEVEYDLKVVVETKKGRKINCILLGHTFEVYGRTWREDMHPDGIGYWETFAEENEGALDDYLDDLKVPFKNYDDAEADQQAIIDSIYEDDIYCSLFEDDDIVKIVSAELAKDKEITLKKNAEYRLLLKDYIKQDNAEQVAKVLTYIYSRNTIYQNLEEKDHITYLAQILMEQIKGVVPTTFLFRVDAEYDKMFAIARRR